MENMEEMTLRRALGLLAFLAVIVAQGIGCIRFGWSFPQIVGDLCDTGNCFVSDFWIRTKSGVPAVLSGSCQSVRCRFWPWVMLRRLSC